MSRVIVFYADKVMEESEIASFSSYPDGAYIRMRLKSGKLVWYHMNMGATDVVREADLPPAIQAYNMLLL